MTFLRSARRLSLALVAAAAAELPVGAAELNDYPTAARADYVFACMKTNGETRRALERCSCSIYVIASILHQMPGPLKRGRTQVAEQNDVTKGSIC